jgi:uncharacterized protein (TIGR04255 family)
MPQYERHFISQVVIRADFVQNTVPMVQPSAQLLTATEGFPIRNQLNRTKSEVRIQKTPQGPVKDTHTTNYVEHNFWTEDKTGRVTMCSEYVFVETRRYAGYVDLRDTFVEALDAIAAEYPQMKLRRLGMRYINEIKLPEADAGPGLGADFWQNYINPLLLGGLRFAANDGALARHMCTTELNYGTDRATIRYGIFNGEYPKPNRRREFILDVDTYCQTDLTLDNAVTKLDDYHSAALSVFEAAITDALRQRMNRPI